MVQTRIDRGTIGALQIPVREAARAAGAFGHIVACQLDMHSAQVGAGFRMNAKGALQLAQDVLETASL